MAIINMNDLNLHNKRVLIRSDLNVPIKNGKILCDSRIISALPTIKLALEKGAKVIVASHLGRPKEGEYDEKFSLLPIVNYLKNKLINKKIKLVKNYLNGITHKENELIVLENVRFNIGEKNNNKNLSKKYAALCDIFIMDAFGTAHRAQASTYGIGKFSSMACAGLLLTSEIQALSKIMIKPERPLVAIVGGSKVSTKCKILHSLVNIADHIIVGGGIANTFIAIDNNIGASLYEPEFIQEAKYLREHYPIEVPIDVRVSIESSNIISKTVQLNEHCELNNNEIIIDIGDKTIDKMVRILKTAKTILWNGPVGMFESPNFRKGTEMIANAIIESNAFSVAGGGDTLAAINLFGIENKISYISTGGGAFLEFLEGKKLPAIAMLENYSK